MDETLENKRVVIVGGGFGGLKAARSLCGIKGCEITLVDARNHHLFQPLLYQVATAALSPADIATPIRSVVTNCQNVRVILAEASRVDAVARRLHLTDGTSLEYDYLLLACGAGHSYFNHPEWEEHAPGLKTLEQATEIRRRILFAFEQAEKETDAEARREWQTFIIVGGGPTGVELAGSIAEIGRFTLERDFRHISPDRTRVILVEAGPRIMPMFSEKLATRAARDLERLGVQVWTTARVSGIDASGVQLGNEAIRARTVIWSAGVAPSPLGRSLGAPLDRLGRVVVEKDLSVPGHPEIFVIGDMAACLDEKGQPLPGIAPVAIQQGRHVAKVLRESIEGRARTPFRYWDKGMMATIGRKKAIVQTGKIEIGGYFAWLMWLFIHIFYLIGFRNRMLVMLQWAWSYATFQRGARLILERDWRTPKGPKT